MSPYEITYIIVSVGDRIDAQWALFLTIHMALFGAIVYIDRPLRGLEKLAAITFYVIFAIFNYRISIQQQLFYEHAATDLAKFASSACCEDNQIIDYVKSLLDAGQFQFRRLATLAIHLIAAALVIVSIYFDGAFKKSSTMSAAKARRI